MNNIFNIKRFGLVLSKDLQEKWKRYTLQFLTMFGILAVILTLFFYNGYPRDYTESDNVQLLAVASFLFSGFGVFFASTLMEPMREKTGRIAYLTIPASNFEKFFSRWLIVTIGYIIVFFIALWLADAVRVAFLSYNYPELDIRFLDFDKLINPEYEDNYSNYTFFSKYFFGFFVGIYVMLQSLFILGATFWEKATFVKTFSAIVAIILLYAFLNWCMIKIVYDSVNDFGIALVAYLDSILPEERALHTVFLISTCIFAFISLLSWSIAFFRFRESEIIKRL